MSRDALANVLVVGRKFHSGVGQEAAAPRPVLDGDFDQGQEHRLQQVKEGCALVGLEHVGQFAGGHVALQRGGEDTGLVAEFLVERGAV